MNINTGNLTSPLHSRSVQDVKPVKTPAVDKPVAGMGPVSVSPSLLPLVQTTGLVTPIRPVMEEMRSLTGVADQGFGSKVTASLHSAADKERDEILKATKEFEAVFMQYLASALGSSLPGSEMEGSHFYQGMIESHLGQLLADSGDLHLGDSLVSQIQKMSEGE
jgi:hypothetical protein